MIQILGQFNLILNKKLIFFYNATLGRFFTYSITLEFFSTDALHLLISGYEANNVVSNSISSNFVQPSRPK